MMTNNTLALNSLRRLRSQHPIKQLLFLSVFLYLAQARSYSHPLLGDGGQDCTDNPAICGDMEHCELNEKTMKAICVHKPLFPAEPIEIWGLFAITFLMLLCTAGGIGGGVVVAPMCIAFFGFGTKEAIALSGFSIFLS